MELLPKCRECSHAIEDGTTVIYLGGQLIHVHCWARVRMQDQKYESRQRVRKSNDRIIASRARMMGRSFRCMVCREAILDRFDIEVHDYGFTHRACSPSAADSPAAVRRTISCGLTFEEWEALLAKGNLPADTCKIMESAVDLSLPRVPLHLLEIPLQDARDILMAAEQLGLTHLAQRLRIELGPTYWPTY